jgi:hypothetical protein
MITPRQDRIATLRKAGVPASFLQALDTLADYGDLQHVLQAPDAAYFYLPSIDGTYESLAGWTVTPVCDGSNGDVFYVLLTRPGVRRFVYFTLESDEIHEDFGAEFPPLLAHLLVDLYEFSELPVAELAAIGQRLGFPLAASLFEALEQADAQGLRRSGADDKAWRAVQLPRFLLTA